MTEETKIIAQDANETADHIEVALTKKPSIGGFPQTWKHKETGKLVRATPWWEILEDDKVLEGSLNKDRPQLKTEGGDRRFKIGCLIQVGWLLENEHGVWLGVSLEAAESFEQVTSEKDKYEEEAKG